MNKKEHVIIIIRIGGHGNDEKELKTEEGNQKRSKA